VHRGGIAMSMPGSVDRRDVVCGFQHGASRHAHEGAHEQACVQLGCAFFALTHHVNFGAGPERGARLHNRPWSAAQWFDAHTIGPTDPAHRASGATAAGFHWRDIDRLVAPIARRALAGVSAHRIGHGLTIPAHVPSTLHGSCSFATRGGTGLADTAPLLAQLAGTFAFEAARHLVHPKPGAALARLAQRLPESILWVARDTTERGIRQILHVSSATVIEPWRNVRDRCDTPTRVTRAVRALVDGDISFNDTVGRSHPHVLKRRRFAGNVCAPRSARSVP
jgi:LuxR family quorum-sensing system transcriptional regulator CciR